MELPKKRQSGQALLLVLLGMAVVLTLVLSVVSRTITDVSFTQRDEDAQRAFSAAEAGVENAIIAGIAGEMNVGTIGNFTSSVAGIADGKNVYQVPSNIKSGEVATLWFVSHDDDGDLICTPAKPCFAGSEVDIYWGDEGTESADGPALEISLYFDDTGDSFDGDYSGVKIARKVYDPDQARIDGGNGFTLAQTNSSEIGEDEKKYAFHTGNIDLLSGGLSSCESALGCLLFLRTRIIYGDGSYPVAFLSSDDNPFPSQGKLITSTGTSGDSTRRIEAYQTYREPIPLFDNAIYSGSNLSK